MTLPVGPAVSFLFTDIEASTQSERAVGYAAWATVVGRHDELLRRAIETHGGAVVKTEGDAFFAAFADPGAAVAAAVAAQRSVRAETWGGGLALRVRMGIHLGEGRLRARQADGDPEDYVGIDVNYAARIAAAGNGGQIVLSDALVRALPVDLAGLPGVGDAVLALDGQRTVKDFDEPLPLYRLVVPGAADDARRLRTTDVPSNLPGDVTSLIGRDDEVAALRGELAETRILTLVGPGGSGKTRLALALARDARDRFPHGVWFVDLAAVRDPAALEPAIATALGVRESPDRAAGEALRVYLRERTALLLLDNLEQLLPSGAEVVARLVRAAPEVRVLVTSRELLRITGERGHPVPPLETDAAVALFVDRARGQRPDLVLTDDVMASIRSICERLGGLPLALELAAARVRLLSPAHVLERLGRSLDLGAGPRDVPERQRTLRGAVAWSYELLPAEERRLFARLAVFASGWTAEAAERVADPGRDLGLDVVAGLESLVDKSLVRVDPGSDDPAAGGDTWFSLHPLLREYGQERLDEAGERQPVERAFLAELAALASAAGEAILGPTGETFMHRLDREDRNLRAAVDLAIAAAAPEVGLAIMGGTWRWFQQRGRLREGRGLLAQLLALPREGDPRVRIAALAADGGLAYWMNDFEGARAAYEERLELAMTTGDPVLVADGHYDLGFLSMVTQEAESLRLHEQQALDLYLEAGREDAAVRARQALVLAFFLVGDYAAARDLERQNMDGFRRTGSPLQVADSMILLSAVHWRLGEPPTAWELATEGLRRFAGVDAASGVARSLTMAAIIQLADGDAEVGARVAGQAYQLAREKGVMLAPVEVLHLPDPAGLAADRLGAERTAQLLAEGGSMALAEVVDLIDATPSPGAAPSA
jgi:predicted ATPase/class 3 adenylate cyclase